MKKLLVGMIVLLSVVAVVNAAEEPATTPVGDGVDVTVDLTYTTKYIWRGFNIYGSHGAIQPSVDFAFENGFSANVWMSYPVGSGENDGGASINDQLTEFDYTLAYSNTLFEDVYQTNYKVGWRYYDYTKTSTKEMDMQEVFAEVSMPNLVGNGLTPRAGVYQMWNSKSGGANSGATGTIYAMGFAYNFNANQVAGDTVGDIPLSFSWDIVYNDGTGGATVDHDWSHMVFGLTSVLDCPALGGKLVPAIYWQNSFEDTVNKDDELWASISFKMSF